MSHVWMCDTFELDDSFTMTHSWMTHMTTHSWMTLCDMTLVWHDSFVRRMTYIRDITHPKHMCDTYESCHSFMNDAYDYSFMNESGHTYDYVVEVTAHHDSASTLMFVTWLSHVCLPWVTWLIHATHMTTSSKSLQYSSTLLHRSDKTHAHVWHDVHEYVQQCADLIVLLVAKIESQTCSPPATKIGMWAAHITFVTPSHITFVTPSHKEKEKYISAFLIGSQISRRNLPLVMNIGQCSWRMSLVRVQPTPLWSHPLTKGKMHFFLFSQWKYFTTKLTASHEHGHVCSPYPFGHHALSQRHKIHFSFLIEKKFHKETYRQPRTWACVKPTPLWSRLLKRRRWLIKFFNSQL